MVYYTRSEPPEWAVEEFMGKWVIKKYGLILGSRDTKEEAEEEMKSMIGRRKKPMKAKKVNVSKMVKKAQKFMVG